MCSLSHSLLLDNTEICVRESIIVQIMKILHWGRGQLCALPLAISYDLYIVSWTGQPYNGYKYWP